MPKINWRKVLGVAKNVGQMFLPEVVSNAIDAIEDNVSVMKKDGKQGWDGEQKQAAALDTLLQSVAVAEGLSGQDLFHDPTVLAAGKKAIDATHAAKVAVAEFAQTVATFKASKNPAALADGTGAP
jgi:hypothetical protein